MAVFVNLEKATQNTKIFWLEGLSDKISVPRIYIEITQKHATGVIINLKISYRETYT